MTPLHPTNLFAVEVPEDVSHIENRGDYIEYYFDKAASHFFTEKLDFKFTILGTVTADTIGFDVEPYINHIKAKQYKKGLWYAIGS